MSADESFIAQAWACSTPVSMTDRSEIVGFYQNKYGDDWKSEIIGALEPIAGLGHKSLARRFQSGRESSPRVSAKQRAEYEQLGEQLPPIAYEPPANGYLVTFIGEIRISKKCYPRSFQATLIGEGAEALANGDVDTAWEAIFFDYFEEELAEGYCGEPSISVSAR